MRDYLLARLGYPAVQVELSNVQLDISIDNALSKYNQYICKGVPTVAYNQSGAVIIQMGPTARGILAFKAVRPQEIEIYAEVDVFQLMSRMVFPNLPIGDWITLRSSYETFQKVRGTDPDYYWDDSSNTLMVACNAGPLDLFYIVATDYCLADFELLRSSYQKDFKDLALAEAKDILGEIRGKFDGTIPVPGGSMATNAATLKAEAAAKRTEIEARLEQIARFSTSPIAWA